MLQTPDSGDLNFEYHPSGIFKYSNFVFVVRLYRTTESDVLRVTIAPVLQASSKTNRTPPFAHKIEIVKDIPSEEASY
jgi:hypothetical protein